MHEPTRFPAPRRRVVTGELKIPSMGENSVYPLDEVNS